MRISSANVNNMATGAMSGAYTKYGNLISKIASNKNFNTMSENVVGGVNVLKLNNQLSELNGYQGNIQHAINEMNLAYDTLTDVTDEISHINSLVVSAANASTTPDAAKAIATEIKQRVGTITDLMNTKYMGNYIFSGAFTAETTYTTDEDGNITYNGSSKETGDRNLMISPDTKFAYNFTGEEIFGKQDGVNDFFAQMKELDTLLNADELDYDSIRGKLKTLEDATSNVAMKNGMVSAKVSKLQATQEINQDTITNLTGKKAEIEEVDIIKAASDLMNAQTGLQASYLLGTNVLNNVSLLDYI